MADFDATRSVMREEQGMSNHDRRRRQRHRRGEEQAMSDIVERLRVGPPTFAGHEGADEIERLRAEIVQNHLDWERLTSGQRRALDPSRQPIFDKLAERDALKVLLERAREALDDEIGGYRKWPNSVGGKLLLDLDAAIDAAREKS